MLLLLFHHRPTIPSCTIGTLVIVSIHVQLEYVHVAIQLLLKYSTLVQLFNGLWLYRNGL